MSASEAEAGMALMTPEELKWLANVREFEASERAKGEAIREKQRKEREVEAKALLKRLGFKLDKSAPDGVIRGIRTTKEGEPGPSGWRAEVTIRAEWRPDDGWGLPRWYVQIKCGEFVRERDNRELVDAVLGVNPFHAALQAVAAHHAYLRAFPGDVLDWMCAESARRLRTMAGV